MISSTSAYSGISATQLLSLSGTNSSASSSSTRPSPVQSNPIGASSANAPDAASAIKSILAQSQLNGSPTSMLGGPLTAATMSAANFTFQVSGGQVTGTYQGNTSSFEYSQLYDLTRQNSMSSQELSQVAYSGTKLSAGPADNGQTFLQTINSNIASDTLATNMANNMISWVNQGRPNNGAEDSASFSGMTDSQITKMADDQLASYEKDTQLSSQIISAYNNHSLQIENSSQVRGLDFEESTSGSTNGAGASAAGGGTLNFNKNFVTQNLDGRQHDLISLGATYAYLSW
jgi:hypothetical protein